MKNCVCDYGKYSIEELKEIYNNCDDHCCMLYVKYKKAHCLYNEALVELYFIERALEKKGIVLKKEESEVKENGL